METEGLIQLLDLAEKQARAVLIDRQRELMPCWVLISDNGDVTVLGTPWRDDHEKRLGKIFMRLQMAKYRTVAYSIVMEAWAAQTTKEEYERDDTPPSQRPDRREVVLAIATDGTQTHWRGWDTVRDAQGKVTALEPRKQNFSDAEIETWMTKLLD